MQAVTLLVAAIASSLVLFLSPIYGLIVYIATFVLYPTYITVPVGTLDFTVRRIVILAVFLKLFLLTNLLKQFKFIMLDKCVIAYFIAQLIAGVVNSSSFKPFLENRCGAIFDMVLPYFAVRIIIQNRQQYLNLLKWILIISVPSAIVGFYECITGNNLASFLRMYHAWGTITGVAFNELSMGSRYGFFRASSVFPHPIMYGLFFAMFGSVCAALIWTVRRHRSLYIIGLILMGVGVFSSMSSGAWLAAFFALLFISSYRWRKYWKPIVVCIVIMCLLVEIISNRHFYDVVDRFALSASNAWYRSRLIEVALFEGGMTGYWLTGYPFGVDPGWGPKIVGFEYTDIVNHYIYVL